MSAGPIPRVLALALVAIALRGVGYAFLTPTYEGWDEYQHLGYFAYLSDKGIPHLGGSVVPASVMEDVGKGPVPASLKSQAPGAWLQTYQEYWRTPSTGVDFAVRLYEAQHPIWYYWLHQPVFSILAGDGYFWSVRGLRLANLAWTLVGVCLVAAILRRLRVDSSIADGALVLLSVQSLFLTTNVRVANDAMASALGCVCFWAILRNRSSSALVNNGVLLAVAGGVKATAWTLCPAALSLTLFQPDRWSRAFWFAVFFASTMAALILLDVGRQGRFAPTQEAWLLAEQEKGLNEVLKSAQQIEWFDEFSRRWGRQLLWVGGWSFATLPNLLPRIHQWLLVVTAFAFLVRLASGGWRDWHLPTFCLLACFGVAGGQSLHMMQTKAALGFVGTPAWYAAIALPWLLAFYAWVWAFKPGLQSVMTTLLFALLLAAEVVGVLFCWLPTFADSTDVRTVISRCSTLAGGGAWFAVGLASLFVGWIAAVKGLRTILSQETA